MAIPFVNTELTHLTTLKMNDLAFIALKGCTAPKEYKLKSERSLAANVFSLFDYKKNDIKLSRFVVFTTDKITEVDALSPIVMQVTPRVFIADMTLMLSHLQKKSQTTGQPISSLVQGVLSTNIQAPLSVSCQHPMQGLVFFYHFQSLGIKGHFDSQTLFANKTYNNIPFTAWLTAAQNIENLCDQNNLYKQERKSFQQQLAKFRRFLDRLQLRSFGELKEVQFYEIQRRYRAFFGLLWKWTFQSGHPIAPSTQTDLFEHEQKSQPFDFPWLPWRPVKPTQLDFSLENALSTWQQIEPELEKNLFYLSKNSFLQNPRRILQLRWTLTLYDLSTHPITIGFKAPISMEKEKQTNFNTIKKQFSYGFDTFHSSLQEKAKELDFVNENLVISWRIEVTKTLIPSPVTLDLIFSTSETRKRWDAITEFNNKIKDSIKVYRSLPHHIFGQDFLEIDGVEADCDTVAINNHSTEHQLNPIYIYPQPIAIQASSIQWQKFLERSSHDWWQNTDSASSFRDYYICENKKGELIWAFRTDQDQWFQHGLFS